MAIPQNTQERIDLMNAALAGASFRVWRKERGDFRGGFAGKIVNDPEHLFDWEKNNYEIVVPHQILFIKSDGENTLIFNTRVEMQADTTITGATIKGRFITGSKEMIKLAKDAELIQ